MAALTMDKLVALCKNRGFVFPGSEIYGGLANTWDYGPLGVEFKNNVKKAWWRKFVQESKTNVGVDCAILMNRNVWVASGHVGNFNDPLMDCKACKARFRADKLIEDFAASKGVELQADGWANDRLEAYIQENKIPCRVKPGGRLVYCTCSLEREEGETQILAFLRRNPDFRTAPAGPAAIGAPLEALTPEGWLRILPSQWPEHGGLDGFFAAKLERVS